jgi:hypothetical protein
MHIGRCHCLSPTVRPHFHYVVGNNSWVNQVRFFHDWYIVLVFWLRVISSRNNQLNNLNSLMAGIWPNPSNIHHFIYPTAKVFDKFLNTL